MKKRMKRLVVLGLCLMMLVTSNLIANAATYDDSFAFILGGSQLNS